MKIIATMPVRNEAHEIGLTLRALLMWVDEVVVLDHASTDVTRKIVDEVSREYTTDRIARIAVTDPVWEEMRHRQMCLLAARRRGATHICMVDADEILTANLLPIIRTWISKTPRGVTLQIPWLCMRGAIDRYHTAGVWAEQDVSMAFEDEPRCCWQSDNGYDFHHRHPCGRPLIPYRPMHQRTGGLMHLQFVNDRRLRAKQALYKVTEAIRWPGRDTFAEINRRYNLAVYGSHSKNERHLNSMVTAEAPASWWAGYEHLMQYYTPEAEPWQEAEVKRLVYEHGAQRFDGLDLFGVV